MFSVYGCGAPLNKEVDLYSTCKKNDGRFASLNNFYKKADRELHVE